MKKKIFSGGMFIEGLRRSKITGIIFLAVAVLVQIIIPAINVSLIDRVPSTKTIVTATTMMYGSQIIPYLLVPILALVLFSVFNKRGGSDFYQALPYTRTCIYVSWTVAILAVSAAVFVIGFFGNLLVMASHPQFYIISFSDFGFAAAKLIVKILFALSAGLLAVSVTGTIFSNTACMILIMLLPRIILIVVRNMIMTAAPIVSCSSFARMLSYQYNIFVGEPVEWFSDVFGISSSGELTWDNVLFTLGLAVIYYCLGMYLFRIRKSETAGNSASGRTVQAIIRCALCFAVSLPGTYMACLVESDDDYIAMAIVIYIVAVLVFFIYEILSTRSWKNLIKAIPSLLIVAALNLLVVGVVNVSTSYINSREISSEDIKYVRIVSEEDGYYDASYVDVVYNTVEINDTESVGIISDRLSEQLALPEHGFPDYYETSSSDENNFYNGKTCYLIEIRTGSGSAYRRLWLDDDEILQLRTSASLSDEFIENVMTLPDVISGSAGLELITYNADFSYSFDDEEAKELQDILQKEAETAGFEKWLAALESSYVSDVYGDDAEIIYSYQYTLDGLNYYTMDLVLDPEIFPEAYEYAADVIEKDIDEDRAELLKTLDKISIDDINWMYSYVTVSIVGDDSFYSYDVDYYDVDYYENDEYNDKERSAKLIDLIKALANDQGSLGGSNACIYLAFDYTDENGNLTEYTYNNILPVTDDFDVSAYEDIMTDSYFLGD